MKTATQSKHSRGDRKITISPKEVKVDLNKVLQDAIVVVNQYGYTVDFGPTVKPRLHIVSKDKTCSCKSADCPSIAAVSDYLRKGGERAPEPPVGFLVAAPETCPICNASAYFDPKMSSKYRGAGWGCSKTGTRHYFAWRTELARTDLAANPWRFPPVVVRGNQQLYAWDGIIENDVVLYPGVLRADLITEGPIGYLE
jgi:hypothetical protein